jgi:hypothetical protein
MGPVLRVFVGGVAAAYLLLGPVFPQVLRTGRHWFPSWLMFTQHGLDLCTVTFTDGVTGERIDRLAALGHEHWSDASTSERTLKDFSAVSRQAKAICKKQNLDDVRVDAYCAIERGWVHVARGRENACQVTAEILAEGHETERPYPKTKTKKP